MSRHSKLALAAALVGVLGISPWAPAISAVPASIPEVISICAPVIAEEYQGRTDRWFQCVQGTQDFVNFVLGPPTTTDDTGQVAADLVLELSKLYQDGDTCKQYETELPHAIDVALTFKMDDERRALIESISASIAACEALETGTIGEGVPTSIN